MVGFIKAFGGMMINNILEHSLLRATASTIIGVLLLSMQAYGDETISIVDTNETMSQEDIDRLKKVMETEIAFHKLHIDLPEEFEMPVRLFEKAEEYSEYQKSISRSTSTTGFYSSSHREIVVNKIPYYFNVMAHEANHFILGTTFKDPPKWINEGTSEYFEMSYVEHGRIYVGEQVRKRRTIQKWLRTKTIVSLSDFLALSNEEWSDQARAPEFSSSTMSWGLIYFLMSNPMGREALHKIFSRLSQGHRNAARLCDTLYVGGLKTLERDFHQFFTTPPPSQLVCLPGNKIDFVEVYRNSTHRDVIDELSTFSQATETDQKTIDSKGSMPVNGKTVYCCSIPCSGAEVTRLDLQGDTLVIVINRHAHPHSVLPRPPEGKRHQFNLYLATQSPIDFKRAVVTWCPSCY